MLYRPTPLFNTYTVSIIQYLFTAESYFDSRMHCIVVCFIYSFFHEKTLGDISFKLETKIMNFISGFFLKKYNQNNSSVVNNMSICLQFSLCRVWVCFYCFHHVFPILSVILTKYQPKGIYIISRECHIIYPV